MRADIYPLHVILLAVSGWLDGHRANVIAYLVEGNRVLKEQMHGSKLRLPNGQRRRLAARPRW